MNKFSVFSLLAVITISGLLVSCSSEKYATSGNKVLPNTSQRATTVNSSASSLQNKYAQLLDVSPSNVQNLKLYKFIDDWYHAPYKYAGRSKSGVDCSDFVSLLLDSVYTISFGGSSAYMFTKTKPVSRQNLREGDLVFFKIAGDRISHVGFYLANNKFVHASVAEGITISDLNDAYYKKYFYSGGRVILN